MEKHSKKIAITIGDVGGISPEVVLKALNSANIFSECHNYLVIGNKEFLYKTASEFGLAVPQKLEIIDIPLDLSKLIIGSPCAEAGKHSFLALKKACELAKEGFVRAIVTAPLSKEAINKAGYYYSGQTEILEQYLSGEIKHIPLKKLRIRKKISGFLKSKLKKMIPLRKKSKAYPEMLFVADNLRVLLLTRHINLDSVSSSLTIKGVIRSIYALNNSLKKDFKISNPKIAICGINPHAGENGLLGHEEDYILKPALEKLRKKFNIAIDGPFPADTLWAKTAAHYFKDESLPYDAYIACYHDQGLIPVKMLAMEKAVNTTINLPVIRTSPCHGTAYDIALQDKADFQSMIEAINLADELSSEVEQAKIVSVS
jgi:4-hydroxythreonine-4-phosphate dehydrogenase